MPIEEILKAYGIREPKLLPVRKGYRNESHAAHATDGQFVNVIIYKREPEILDTLKKANLVGNYLAEQGFPARRTKDSRIICLSSAYRERYAALYEYLPGETIPWEAYTMEHIKHLGASMSTMHQILKVAPFKIDTKVSNEYLSIIDRMRHYFSQQGVKKAVADKLKLSITLDEKLTNLLVSCSNLPNQHTLHMDFVRGNILFDESPTITGVIDFEKAAWGHPMFDIARTYAFLIVDCKYKTESQVRKYFLQSGYNKRGKGSFKITVKNRALLERLTNLFLLYDFYKFLLHNPYESLPQNEHFVRTRDILLQRKVIARV